MYHQHFDPELIDLCVEVGEYHPDVMAILTALADKDIYMQIAAISAHCGMILHGDYTKEDILGICKTLTEKLRKKREIVLYSGMLYGTQIQSDKKVALELDMSMMRELPEDPKSIN